MCLLQTWAEGVLTIAAGLLLGLLLEWARRRVSQTEPHVMLLSWGWSWAPRRDKHSWAVLEGSSTGYGAGHTGIVRQACVAVAWRQKSLLSAMMLRLALGLSLGLRRLWRTLALSLALGLGWLCCSQACRGRWGGGVIPAKLVDLTWTDKMPHQAQHIQDTQPQ